MSKVSQKMTVSLIFVIAGGLMALGSMAWAYANGQLSPKTIPSANDLWPLYISITGLILAIFGAVRLAINVEAWVIEGMERTQQQLES